MTQHTSPHTQRRQIALVLMSCGGALLAASILYPLYSIVSTSDMVATQGVVNRIESRRVLREDSDDPSDSRYVTVHKPIVQYQVDHVTHELDSADMLGASVGEKVGVLYPPEQPDQGIVNTVWNRWGLPLTFGSFGLFFLLGGLLVLPRTAATTAASMFVWNEDAPTLGFVLIGIALGGPLTGFLWWSKLPGDFLTGIFLLISLAVLILFPWAGFYLLYRQVRARWCFACHGPREKWNDYWYQCHECGRGRWFEIPDGDKSKYQRRRQS